MIPRDSPVCNAGFKQNVYFLIGWLTYRCIFKHKNCLKFQQYGCYLCFIAISIRFQLKVMVIWAEDISNNFS
jgi:hypothetical protein